MKFRGWWKLPPLWHTFFSILVRSYLLMGLSDCWLMYDWLNLLLCLIDDSFIYASFRCWVLLFSWLSTFASSCLSICRCSCLLESFNSLIHFLACLSLASVSTCSRYSCNSSSRPSPSSVSFLFFHSFFWLFLMYLCLLIYFSIFTHTFILNSLISLIRIL